MYLRTSSRETQNPKAAHERQQFSINQYLIQPSLLPVIAVYAEVESGLDPNRPEYQRLLQDARLGKFSHIAVASPDRFGRDPLEAVQRYQELANLGIAVQVAESSHPLPPSTPTSPKEQADAQEA